MIYSWQCFYLIFAIFRVAMIDAGVIPSKSIECECFNKINTKTSDKCHGNTITCVNSDSTGPGRCFALWETDNVTGTIDVKMKGCINHGMDPKCMNLECIDRSKAKKVNYCCCSGHMCNAKHELIPTTLTTTTTEAPPMRQDNFQSSSDTDIDKYIFFECGILLIIAIVILPVSFYKSKKNAKLSTKQNEGHGSYFVSFECVKELPHLPIKLVKFISNGRFGSVWQATLKSSEVAVKVFSLANKDSWTFEQNIFNLPRMKHPNILEFVGAEKHLERSECWLITTYHPHGSLCDYLKVNQLSWLQLARIAESMTKGLMYLHEEIKGHKPAIAHRDFKSKNVLLKSDLTACIADFGFALVFQPGEPIGDKHGQVGTLRYMAPEILEGAIDFSCESFLRIDVYACALVLWELVSRCTAHGAPFAEHELPFEHELGLQPTLKALQKHIVENRYRPEIPEDWRVHSGLNTICDTMEECWDHEADARPTASCVHERISEYTIFPTIV